MWQTAGCSLTAQQPLLNILRTGYEALSAVLGGCQSLHTNSYDGRRLPFPRKSGGNRFAHAAAYCPRGWGNGNHRSLAGSYYVESMTNRIEEEARQYLEKIEEMGGMVAAIDAGYVQDEIATSSYEYQKKVVIGGADNRGSKPVSLPGGTSASVTSD